MPILSSNYNAPWLLNNGHLNTLWPALFRKPPPLPSGMQRVRIDTPDGDFLDLDLHPASTARHAGWRFCRTAWKATVAAHISGAWLGS